MSTPLLIAALGLAACGREDPSATAGSQKAQAREAMLQFARCMREHGVDMPDPKVDEGGRVTLGSRPGSGRPDPRKFDEAQEACQKYMEAVEPPKLDDEQRAQIKEQSLAHARCMREHGIDFPDPKFSEDGGAMVRIEPGRGIDPQSPRFLRAEKACAKELEAVGGGAPEVTREVAP